MQNIKHVSIYLYKGLLHDEHVFWLCLTFWKLETNENDRHQKDSNPQTFYNKPKSTRMV